METNLNYQSYQKLIDDDIQALKKCMPENSLEKNHIIEVLQWSVDEIYGKHDKNDVLKKCVITRYDRTIKEPPFFTLPIDEAEVFEPQNDECGEEFSARLRSTCEKKGYRFQFYTTCSGNDKYDYEIVVK